MGPLPFRIDATNVADPTIQVDGRDVSRDVRAFRLDCAPGIDLPVLTLELRPGAGPVEGTAIVQVAAPNPAALVAEFLAAVDPAELERVALNGDLSQGVMPAVLAELARLAEAHPWT